MSLTLSLFVTLLSYCSTLLWIPQVNAVVLRLMTQILQSLEGVLRKMTTMKTFWRKEKVHILIKQATRKYKIKEFLIVDAYHLCLLYVFQSYYFNMWTVFALFPPEFGNPTMSFGNRCYDSANYFSPTLFVFTKALGLTLKWELPAFGHQWLCSVVW